MPNNDIELDVRPRRHIAEENDFVPPTGTDDLSKHVEGEHTPSRTKEETLAGRLQFIGCCVPLFVAGWNDGSLGPLIPRIQAVYNINFTIVSLLFVLACVGFLIGAMLNLPLSDKLGFGKILALGSVLQIIGFVLMSPGLPFPVFVVAYTINSIGVALQDAQANGYVASLERNRETKMGIMHAIYGAGALCAPLVATQFAQHKHWSYYFLTSLGIAIINTAVIVGIFRFKRQDDCLIEIGQAIPERTSTDAASENGKLWQILSHRTVQLLAFFILFYVGVEVTLGGWIVTFIRQERHGGPSSGYISAGFFGGLMVGRVALLWLNKKIGERRVIFLYTFLAIGLELIIWFVPSLVGNAVAVSLVGMVLGPMYPIAMNHAGRVLPRWMITGSIGWIAGFGISGSAIFPFMTGAISNKYGIKSLQPLVVAMLGLLVVLWAIVPGHRRPD